MKKVSVIIPTYKRASMLDRAIKSVLNQTYKNIEIIVVDDNDASSTYRLENEKKMQKYHEFSNVFYLKHKKNKNGAAARNTGIKKATGDYLTFLDDDDYFFPNRIEKLVECLESNLEYAGAYTSVIFTKNNQITSTLSAIKSGNFKVDLLKQKSFFGTGSNLFLRKTTVDKIGVFNEDFIRHQDIEYMIRFFDYGKMLALNEFLVVKCVDDRTNFPSFEKMIEVKKLFFDKFAMDIKNLKNEANNVYFENYLNMLYLYFNNKKHRRYILNELKKYGKVSFKIKIKCLYLSLKKIPIIGNIKKLLSKKVEVSPEIREQVEYLGKL